MHATLRPVFLAFLLPCAHYQGVSTNLSGPQTCSGQRCLLVSLNEERWRELCEQVAVEQDPKKLVELTTEIYRFLEEMRRRLQRRSLMDGALQKQA